eukprot:TRINITY_DN1111_c0_g4_i2.p1 TRINITY_DN1111_c0_g4~~TRINITY_DN1111_c0_g4_i2.p1  ORF type:complete len:831 (+),score=185.84 TRINITY_DN1111_c0_g4_i2:55-2493(+)
MAPGGGEFGTFSAEDVARVDAEERRAVVQDIASDDEDSNSVGDRGRRAPPPEDKRRARQLEKSFQSWNVDKRKGVIPPEEVTQLVATFRCAEQEAADTLQANWAKALTSEWEVVAAIRDSNPLRGIGISRITGNTVDPDAFLKALVEDLSPNPTAPVCASSPQYLKVDITAQNIRCVQSDELPPSADAARQASVSAADAILSSDRTGPLTALTLTLVDVPASKVVETERRAINAMTNDSCSKVQKGFVIDSVRKSKQPEVPATGLSRSETKQAMLRVSQHMSSEAFDEFAFHIMETLDFIYDLSLENRRSRHLFELFKEWDTKGHGFIDRADLAKRLSTMRFFLDRGVDIGRLLDDMSLPEDVSLRAFQHVMQQLFEPHSEEEVHEVLRTLKHQLQGDDDIRDTNYAVNKYLRSEIEKEQKREERMRQLAERRASWSGSVIASAKHDVARGRIARLEQERKHAFDSIAFDDITAVLEAKIMSPGARLLYEQVATACSLLLDMPPVLVDGRLEYWAALRDALKADMPGFLRQLRDLNPSSVSLVRIRKCMNFFYMSESDPSNVLRHSWFLSATCRWCHAVANLACVFNGWEWPPAALPPSTRDAGASPQGQAPGAGAGGGQASRGNGSTAARALSAHGGPSTAPRSAASYSIRRPQPPPRPRPGTAGAERAGLTAKTSRYGKLLDTLSNCCIFTSGKTTTRLGTKPTSPFPASDLFVRRRHAASPGWEHFWNRTRKEAKAASDQQEAAAEEHRDAGVEEQMPVLSEVDSNHLSDMLKLNAELGLPVPAAYEFIGGGDECSAPYWDGCHEEDDS